MRKALTSVAVMSLLWSSLLPAAGKPPEMSRAEFDQLMTEISNHGRWGSDDQLGTLNLITPENRKAAAALVEDGVSVSMSLDMNKREDAVNTSPLNHEVSVAEFGGHVGAVDTISVLYHGYAHSHMDGLQHIAHDGKLYNGMAIDRLPTEGVDRLGIQNAGISGIVTRGVIVDLPRYFGVDYVSAGTAIFVRDLEAWEEESGVRIGSGDVLLVRTGRWQQVADQGQWDMRETAAGLHASLARWLKQRDVAMIGSDGVSDVVPSGVEGLVIPLHELVIAGLGMPMLDNLDLDEVAAEAAARNRATFMFVGAPLRIPGGTGSPLNPLAIF